MIELKEEKIKKEIDENSPEIRIFVEMSGFESVLREAFRGCESVEIITCAGGTVQNHRKQSNRLK